MQEKNKLFIILLLIHALTVFGLLAIRIVSGQDYFETVLNFDGYYNLAKSFVYGGALARPAHGPVLPLILSILFIFPESIHPFVRLFMNLLFSYGTIYILFEITKNYLNKRQFFVGSLIFLLNPVFFHWTFKGAPEIYLCFFLALFILFFIKYYQSNRLQHLLFAVLAFVIGFFIKPVFLFIPPLLFLSGLFLIKSKRIVIISLLLIIIGFISFKGYKISTETRANPNSPGPNQKHWGNDTFLILDSYWVDYVIKTGQFHKGTLLEYKAPGNIDAKYPFGGSVYDLNRKTSRKWVESFVEKFPGRGPFFMNLYFIYDKPLLFLQKLVFSPIFFFSMSARPLETFLKLFLSLVSIGLSVGGIIILLKNPGFKKEIIIILSIILGFALLHFVTHSINRYSYPILPYFFIWGGIVILKIKPLNGYLKRKKIFADSQL